MGKKVSDTSWNTELLVWILVVKYMHIYNIDQAVALILSRIQTFDFCKVLLRLK
jgi:hypothetical protein